MKRFLFILVAVGLAVGAWAEEKSINPTACGITVGQTTKTGKTLAEWGDILKDYRPMNLIASSEDQRVLMGDFPVEGFHMSLLNMELVDDTVYQLSFYERSPYADCWDLYKDLAFKLRDKYAHFEDVVEPIEHETDSAVSFFKTDGKTEINFSADPHSISLSLTSVHLQDIKTKRVVEEIYAILNEKTGPNYDESNKVTKIAGVRFGETRNNVINAFKQRGTFLKNEDKLTYFIDVNFGGTTYSIATFFFQYDTRRYDNVLAAAKFEKNFSEWRRDEAVMMYENVVSSFQRKYSNSMVVRDEKDSKAMVCGMLEDDYMNGGMPPIIVSLELGLSRGGDKYYYVTVTYFEQKMSHAAADDI